MVVTLNQSTVFTKIEFILNSIYGAQTPPYIAIKFILPQGYIYIGTL
jgi:hypothetical protein